MATIATLKKADGNLEGTLTTLKITAPIAILPNGRKAKDSAPDYLVVSRKNGFELGAGWNRASKSTGEEYISVSLSAPEFWTIYGNVAPAPRGRREEEGHHLEPRERVRTRRPREIAGPVAFASVRSGDSVHEGGAALSDFGHAFHAEHLGTKRISPRGLPLVVLSLAASTRNFSDDRPISFARHPRAPEWTQLLAPLPEKARRATNGLAHDKLATAGNPGLNNESFR
jgi:uncharacterized protein (DUF736 family)